MWVCGGAFDDSSADRGLTFCAYFDREGGTRKILAKPDAYSTYRFGEIKSFTPGILVSPQNVLFKLKLWSIGPFRGMPRYTNITTTNS